MANPHPSPMLLPLQAIASAVCGQRGRRSGTDHPPQRCHARNDYPGLPAGFAHASPDWTFRTLRAWYFGRHAHGLRSRHRLMDSQEKAASLWTGVGIPAAVGPRR